MYSNRQGSSWGYGWASGEVDRRRPPPVVVRAGAGNPRRSQWSPLPPDVAEERRRPLPTLTGLGDDERDQLPPPRRPQATLRAGVDETLARAYRYRADRILASGVFPKVESAPANATPLTWPRAANGSRGH